MPFAMVFIGLLMVISGVRDTHIDLGNELVTDIGGKGGFGTRLLAIGAVGAVGYLGGEWKRLSVYFMVLVLVALMFSADKGFFQQLTNARLSGPATVTANPAASASNAAPVAAPNAPPKADKSSSNSDMWGTVAKYAGMALMFL